MIACVSPADIHVEESLSTLRYAQRSRSITNSLRHNVVDAMMSPSQFSSLLAENKTLKARILNMKRQSDDGDDRSFRLLQSSASTSSVVSTLDYNPDFSDIRARLRLAEAEAKVTREYYNSLKVTHNNLKAKYDPYMFKSAEVSKHKSRDRSHFDRVLIHFVIKTFLKV